MLNAIHAEFKDRESIVGVNCRSESSTNENNAGLLKVIIMVSNKTWPRILILPAGWCEYIDLWAVTFRETTICSFLCLCSPENDSGI